MKSSHGHLQVSCHSLPSQPYALPLTHLATYSAQWLGTQYTLWQIANSCHESVWLGISIVLILTAINLFGVMCYKSSRSRRGTSPLGIIKHPHIVICSSTSYACCSSMFRLSLRQFGWFSVCFSLLMELMLTLPWLGRYQQGNAGACAASATRTAEASPQTGPIHSGTRPPWSSPLHPIRA